MADKFKETMKDPDNRILGSAGVAGSGGLITKNVLDKGHLTGRETLYHNTRIKDAPSVLKEGLKSSYASDPNNLTNKVLTDIPKKDIANKVYFGRKKLVSDAVGQTRSIASNMGVPDSVTLKAKVPTWKLKEVENPELRGAKNLKEFKEKRDANRGFLEKMNPKPLRDADDIVSYNLLGRKGTAVFEGDIGSEFFKKSKNYKGISAKELGSFIKHDPKRFAKGVAGAGAGFAIAGAGTKMLYDSIKYKKENDNMNKVAMYKEEIYKIAKEQDPNKTKLWKDRIIPGMGISGIGGAILSSPITKPLKKVVQTNAAQGRVGKALALSSISGLAAGAAGGGINAYRLKKLHNKEFGTNPTKEDYENTVAGAALFNPIGTPEAIIKAKKRELAKEAAEKDPNRTTFWNDRVWSNMKEELGGGLPGAIVGGVVGAKMGKHMKGMVAGSVAGTSTARALRLKNIAKKEGVKLEGEDYAKAIASTAARAIPGAGLMTYTNTPEAIVKYKKIEALEKSAKEKDSNKIKFMRDRVLPAYVAGTGGAIIASPLKNKLQKAGFVKGFNAVPYFRSIGSDRIPALIQGAAKGAPYFMAGAVATGGAQAGINMVRLNRLHNKKLGTNPTGKDYAQTSAGILLSPFGLAATPEVIIKKKKRAMEKSAEFKAAIGRNNQEWKDNGGSDIKQTFNQYTKPVLKKYLGGAVGGAGAGAIYGKAKGGNTASGALIGGSVGAIGGALAGMPDAIKLNKNDNATVKSMVKNRLGEGATDEQIKKAMLKWNLTGVLPNKK